MTLQQQIRANRLRSAVVVAGFFVVIAVLVAAVSVLFDVTFGGFALVGALLYAAFALVNSRRIVGRMTGVGSDLSDDAMRQVRRLVENVSIAAGLPTTPEVRIVRDDAPNAFATGLRPETSFVGVTTGLLKIMPKRELEAVLAHELAHVRNRDTYLMTMAAIFAGVIAFVADIAFRSMLWGGGGGRSRSNPFVVVLAVAGLLLAPFAATLMKLALSRRREFLADATAAEILNDPEAMALALQRLEADTTTVRYAATSVAHLWIESPADRVESSGHTVSGLQRMFNTHPPLLDRILALEHAGGFRLPADLPRDRPYVTLVPAP